MIWVKCMKCSQGYEMGEKQYYKELEEMAKANPSPIPVAMPLKCQKCGQDGGPQGLQVREVRRGLLRQQRSGGFRGSLPQVQEQRHRGGPKRKKVSRRPIIRFGVPPLGGQGS